MKTLCLILFLLFSQVLVYADQEASNTLYVTAEGAWYAKSIPSERYGTRGKTLVYLAGEKTDSLQYTFDWYSPWKLYLRQWGYGVSVIRFGPLSRGNQASANDLALEFYNGNTLLSSYSTLDLAGSSSAVSSSVSHYWVIRKILGYRKWARTILFLRSKQQTASCCPSISLLEK